MSSTVASRANGAHRRYVTQKHSYVDGNVKTRAQHLQICVAARLLFAPAGCSRPAQHRFDVGGSVLQHVLVSVSAGL